MGRLYKKQILLLSKIIMFYLLRPGCTVGFAFLLAFQPSRWVSLDERCRASLGK